MSAPIRSVALLGTGIMGVPIGRNLLEAGYDLRAWNRTRDKAEPLAAAGAQLARRRPYRRRSRAPTRS